MRRVIAVVVLLLATLAGGAARAHNLSLVAAVSLSGNEVTLRPLDPYGAALEGAAVTAAAVPAGGKQGKLQALKEGPPGSYRGQLVLPGAGDYKIVAEARVGTELFRVEVPARAGEGFPERLLPMQAIEEQPGFSWGPVLYGAAVIVLATGTAYAMLRRRQVTADEEE